MFQKSELLVFGSEELLSNAGGLWSVILPLSAHKLMKTDERDCRGKSEASESYLTVTRKDTLGNINLPISNMVSALRRGHEGEKNRIKIVRLTNAAMSGLPAEFFLAINVVFVGAG